MKDQRLVDEDNNYNSIKKTLDYLIIFYIFLSSSFLFTLLSLSSLRHYVLKTIFFTLLNFVWQGINKEVIEK